MKTRQQAADGFYRHLREWFTAFLPRQRGAARNTITSCRQTWNMLLRYVAGHHHVAVENVTFAMVDRATVTGFLDHMQATKSWTASTRNQRLACIRSFFTYAAAAEPTLAIYLADLAAIPRLNGPSMALLAALCVFRLLPDGFTNAQLRRHVAGLLGQPPDSITGGRMTYDLRRLRLHGLIERIAGSHRYQVTDAGWRSALALTRVHNRVLRPSLASLHDPELLPPSLRRPLDRLILALDGIPKQAKLIA